MQTAGASSDCDWCGKAADPHDDDCIQLTCNAACHAPKECGIYHEKCIKQYLRSCSGKNYDPSRKSGFPCPRGLGKAKATKCKGKITHMQRCVMKSKPAATPAAAPAGPATGSKRPTGAQTKAGAKVVAQNSLGAKAAAAACPALRQPKVIKAVQVHKPLTTSLSCKGEAAAAVAATVLDSRESLRTASSVNSSSSMSDTVAYQPDSLGGNTLAAALAVASRAPRTNAKRTGAKPSKQESSTQDVHQQHTPPGSCEANSSQDSTCRSSAGDSSSTTCGPTACGSTACGSTACGSTCGSAGTDSAGSPIISRLSTSMTSTDIVSASTGIAASASTSTSCLVEWGSACATDADVGCADGTAAVRQDDYAYIESDSEVGEEVPWSPTQDDVSQPPQQLTQQQETQQDTTTRQQQHFRTQQQETHHQQPVAGSYSLFGDSSLAGGLAGGLAGLATVLPGSRPAAVPPCIGPVSASRQESAVLPPANGKQTMPGWPQVQQPWPQQLTALQQAQLQYQQYRSQQQKSIAVQTKAVDKQPIPGMYVSSICRHMQWQQEQKQRQQQVHWAGSEILGHAPAATAEYDATDEELLALLMS